MIALVAKYHAKPSEAEDVFELLRKMKSLVERDQPNDALYQASRSTEHDDFTMLYEHYHDNAALAGHRETPQFRELIEGKVIPMLEKREREREL